MIKEEIISIYEKYADNINLPIIDLNRWKDINNTYDKDDLLDSLIEYFIRKKPGFPYREFNEQDVKENFLRLYHYDLSEHIFPKENCEDVLEKYDDYVGNWPEWGLGVISFSANFNDISDFFMNHIRLKCGHDKNLGPVHQWTEQINLKQFLSPIWRLDPTRKSPLSRAKYQEGIRVGSYVATQFKPPVAKSFYDITKSVKVIDTSSGWGDRMAGFYTSKAKHYLGMDPNGENFPVYLEMAKAYENWLGNPNPIIHKEKDYFRIEGIKTVEIYRSPAEDVPWDDIPCDYDCMFSSPPYFATERYGEGGEFEDDQSWSRYNSYEKWRDGFYFPVMDQVFKHLNPGGHMIVNIMDSLVKNKRQHSCDDLVNRFKDNFVGQIGMKIRQRPKSLSSFEGETTEEKKKNYDEWARKWFVESCWVFRKPNGEEFDLFSDYRRATLESFFG